MSNSRRIQGCRAAALAVLCVAVAARVDAATLSVSKPDGGAMCGNGVVEGSGEECDNGPANGATTSCCMTDCKFRKAGETCRPARGACDVAEVCSGTSSACPADASSSLCHASGAWVVVLNHYGRAHPTRVAYGIDGRPSGVRPVRLAGRRQQQLASAQQSAPRTPCSLEHRVPRPRERVQPARLARTTPAKVLTAGARRRLPQLASRVAPPTTRHQKTTVMAAAGARRRLAARHSAARRRIATNHGREPRQRAVEADAKLLPAPESEASL